MNIGQVAEHGLSLNVYLPSFSVHGLLPAASVPAQLILERLGNIIHQKESAKNRKYLVTKIR